LAASGLGKVRLNTSSSVAVFQVVLEYSLR
jgi:hypothetical protein